jgi:hypothetical protein
MERDEITMNDDLLKIVEWKEQEESYRGKPLLLHEMEGDIELLSILKSPDEIPH